MASKEPDNEVNGVEGHEPHGCDSENARDKRIRELEEEAKVHKKVKTSVNALAQEYTCPITQDLMVDPVMAKDGHLYERAAIEETIRVQGNALKSPKTGLKMKPELLPAVTAKNTIEALVESGAIDGDDAIHYRQGKLVFDTKKKANEGDIGSMQSLGEWYRDGTTGLPKDKELAKKWLEKATDAMLVRDTMTRAEAGDAEAMYDLGGWYEYGSHGCEKNDEMARSWLEKAAALKYVPAMARYALFVLRGKGGDKNLSYGTLLLMEAAMAGSDYACTFVGFQYFGGGCDIPINYKEARRWLTKATDGSCAFKHDDNKNQGNAKRLLAEVTQKLEGQANE